MKREKKRNNFINTVFSGRGVLVLATVLSIISFFYFFQTRTNLAFNDAKSHLDITRRIVDNIHPGLAQLGNFWLPLLHLFMLPFIRNDFLWHSGIAGSLVNMPAYILASVFIYKSLFLITESNGAAFFGSLIYMINPNMLYMQTTAMSEVLFTMLLSGSVYFLLKWWQHMRYIPYLMLASAFVFLSSLSRYEGWGLAIASTVCVSILSFIKTHKIKVAEGRFIVFGTVAGLGILLWLGWQWAIFGNPLYFIHSDFSAVGQTKVAVALGTVPAYHHLGIAILSFWYAVANTAGFWLTVLATLSVPLLLFYSIYTKKFGQILIVLLLLTPYVFEMYSLYTGSAPINVVQIYPYRSFNVRFGLYLFPALAVILGYVFKISNSFLRIVLIAVLLTQSYVLYTSGPLSILTEDGTANSPDQQQIVSFLKAKYQSGTILASAAVTDPIMFDSGLPLKTFISEGSGVAWDNALTNPQQSNISYILTTKDEINTTRDGVYKEVILKKRATAYHEVFSNTNYAIYEK
jgi:hypothetical protein